MNSARTMKKNEGMGNALHDDDISVLTFADDSPSTDSTCLYPSLDVCSPNLYEIDASQRPRRRVSVEESLCNQGTYQQPVPSMDVVIKNLTKSMMRSAKSREMLSKSLSSGGFGKLQMESAPTFNESMPKTKPHVHKVQRSPHKYQLGALKSKDLCVNDNTVGGFLRASKKW